MLAPPPLPRTLQASLRDLESKKPTTRASAIADLVRHARGDVATRERAVPLLERALSQDEASGVRSAAAVALADLDAREALPALLVAVEDADPYVRQMALSALGEIGDVRAAPRLERALKDDRPEVRYQAVIAFARVTRGADDVAAALRRALDDDDDAVRYIALRLAEERADAEAPSAARSAYGVLAERARVLLADGSEAVRVAAAILLAKLGDPEARPVILRIVRGEGRAEKEDEREVVELAGELALREAIPDLERRAWGVGRLLKDTCAFHAKIALARLGHERAVAEIKRDLRSSRDDQVAAAVVAAGRARLAALRPDVERIEPGRVDPELIVEALARLEAE